MTGQGREEAGEWGGEKGEEGEERERTECGGLGEGRAHKSVIEGAQCRAGVA